MPKLTEEQRWLKSAREAIVQASNILRDEPDTDPELQSIRSAAIQAAQAAADLYVLYGLMTAKRLGK